ncbi:DUF3667 domain-containing protein [Pleionea mediterranea]|uniref:Uncharacterized protein DUF3667 n=1 Tax=Pleionea mediterranea TaxID=523701 RepID=A0A316FUJ6_9GAMM|nr:DUF3667 domain-containing protein [Pleionea mediterranea]PWK51972.1 uncharacterized protein DUF3667 [Pleionea mediterranea]
MTKSLPAHNAINADTVPEADFPSRNADLEACKNCQTHLTGPFCHQCGQPNKSIIRFFGSMIKELLEDIISLDSRAARTLFALLFRPGFLTREYVSGRRFSYVPPLRLYLITSIFCIFVIWVQNKTSDDSIFGQINSEQVSSELSKAQFDGDNASTGFGKLSEQERQKALQELQQANQVLQLAGKSPIAIPRSLQSPDTQIDNPDNKTGETTDTRTEDIHTKQQPEINKPDLPDEPAPLDKTENNSAADPKPLPSETNAEQNKDNKGFVYKEGDLQVDLPWLSKEDNQQLELKLEDNIKNIIDDPNDFFGDLLEVIPKSMLLLVPIFAILMKLSYPFARRYYIEHLIHAFHGHAFLFLCVLLLMGLDRTGQWLSASDNGFVSFIASIIQLVETLLFIWIPVYFLLSIKSVYRQNWFLSVFKWMLTGILYLLLFSFAAITILILSVLFN